MWSDYDGFFNSLFRKLTHTGIEIDTESPHRTVLLIIFLPVPTSLEGKVESGVDIMLASAFAALKSNPNLTAVTF